MLVSVRDLGKRADDHNSQSQQILLTDLEAAALLSISRATIHRLRAAGKLPECVRLGRALRWRREELLAWVAAGAPTLETWRAIRAAEARRASR